MNDFDIELDRELNEHHSPDPLEQRSRGFIGKVVALLLGIILGFVGAFGGVAALGYWGVTQPLNSVVDTVNGLAGTKLVLTEYLTDTYAKGTLQDLIGGIADSINEIAAGRGSLKTLNDISPKVKDTVDDLVEFGKEYALVLDTEEMMGKPFKKPDGSDTETLGEYVVRKLDDIYVVDLLASLNVTVDNLTDSALHKEDGSKLTIGEIKELGFENIAGTLPLSIIMPVDLDSTDESSRLVRELCYGPSSRWYIDGEGENRTIKMAQRYYTLVDGELHDDRQHVLEYDELVAVENGGYKLTITEVNSHGEEKTVSHYIYTKTNADNQTITTADGHPIYYGYEDQEKTTPCLYQETTIGILRLSPSAALNNIELGETMGLTPDDNPLLLTLAYGVKGKDYVIVKDEHGNDIIEPLTPPKTISDLMNGNSMGEIIETLTLDDLLENVDPANRMICALAYGSDRYDVITNSDGTKSCQMKQVRYYFDGTKVLDNHGAEVSCTKGSSNGVTTLTFTETNTDGNPSTRVEYVFNETKDGVTAYYAYEDAAKTTPVLYQKTTVGALQSGADKLIKGIYIADALDVKPSSHRVMIALAYGTEYVDYDIVGTGENAKIVCKPGKFPRTIEKMQGDNSGNLINSLSLGDALNVTATSKPLLKALAYGKEGVDYEIVGTGANAKIKPLGNVKTLNDFSADPSALFDEIYLSDLLENADTSDSITMYILYGKKGVHYNLTGSTVTPLNRRVCVANNKAYNEYGEVLNGTLSGTTSYTEDGKTYTLVSTSLGTIDTVDGTQATIYYLKDSNGNEVKYEPNTVSALTGNNSLISKIKDRLTLVDILGESAVSGNKFFKHVQNEKISNIPSAVENLTFQQVFADEIYVDSTAQTKVLKGTWKYLLTDKDSDTGAEKEYKLTEMNALVENMKANMMKATLNDLSNDGMITGLSNETLNRKVLTTIKIYGNDIPLPFTDAHSNIQTRITSAQGGDLKVGDLTVVEMMEYLDVIFCLFDNLAGA
ncbi:MAG: hypothetical protein IJX75_00855 [Clostridia bacterium]|nr:hypothetical protein [Clostridia bacterium]